MRLRDLILHLRLHWQVMLSPMFLWGMLLSGEKPDSEAWLLFAIFHILFYGGATAFNSYYDKDEGPVHGLWSPPPVTRTLLVFSVTLQVVGLFAVLALNQPLFVLSVLMGVVGNGYSHPAWRLKSRPWASLLAVSIFQGIGGTAAGWLSVTPEWRTVTSPVALGGMLVAFLVITGFYPLTQIYQIEEVRRRGDISFAVRWGERCFALALACMLAAAVFLAVVTRPRLGTSAAVVGALRPLLLAVLVFAWWRRYRGLTVRDNYRRMMQTGYAMTGGFLGSIVWQMIVAA